MAIPTHVADHIEAIQVGSTTFSLNADLLSGHSWSDVTDLVSTGFSITVYTSLPAVPTSSQSAKDEFYREHRAEIALVADAAAAAGTYIEYVLVKTGESPNFNYAWEQIGSTQVDLSNYVQKGVITLAGETGSAGAETINTSNAGAQTASGSATITYEKATEAASAGAHTHSISPTTTTLSYANASQTGATGITTPTTSTTGAHTHSVTTSAHSHTVNLTAATVTYVTGITGGSVAAHSHTYDKASLTGTTTFLTSATGTFLNNATVSSAGVLSWGTASVATTTGAVGITQTSTNSGTGGAHTVSATTATFSNITGATLDTAAPTGEAASNGDHAHTLTSVVSHTHSIGTGSQVVVTGITITGEAGAHTHSISTSSETVSGNVSVAVSSHTHSVTTSNHTHSVQVSGNNYA